MRQQARLIRENRTITVDFQDEATYFCLLDDGKVFVECVIAFLLAIGFQLTHKATCSARRPSEIGSFPVPLFRLRCGTVFGLLGFGHRDAPQGGRTRCVGAGDSSDAPPSPVRSCDAEV